MSQALVAMSVQLAKVSAELAEIKRATTATAAHTAGTKDAVQLQNRNGVQVWSDPKEPLQVEAV